MAAAAAIIGPTTKTRRTTTRRAASYEMGEIYDSSLSADHWSDRHGKKVQLGEIHLDEDEIVADAALDEAEPSREDFEGYTGNEGMTLERWYHRAAVVIWPRSRHFQVLSGAGTEASIGGLEAMVKRLKRAKKAERDGLRRECLSFASAIIDSWNAGGRGYWRQKPEGVDRSVFAKLLFQLDDPELVRRFLVTVIPADAAIELDRSFAEFCTRHGWASFEGELATVLGAATAATVARNAAILRTLCVQRDKNSERIEVCRRLSERSVEALEAFDRQRHDHEWQLQEVDRGAVLGSLVAAMIAVGAEEPLSRLLDHALASDKYDLTDAHLAAIFALERQLAKRSADGAISRWLAACRRELERRTAQAPQKPADYRRAAKLSCNCRDCRALSEFLADPDRREARFPLAKERRRHLHNIIDRDRCDCTHVTEHRGSPHTLVCTKTTASYDAACKIHDRDVKNLSRIAALERRSTNRSLLSAPLCSTNAKNPNINTPTRTTNPRIELPFHVEPRQLKKTTAIRNTFFDAEIVPGNGQNEHSQTGRDGSPSIGTSKFLRIVERFAEQCLSRFGVRHRSRFRGAKSRKGGCPRVACHESQSPPRRQECRRFDTFTRS